MTIACRSTDMLKVYIAKEAVLMSTPPTVTTHCVGASEGADVD